MHVDAKGEKYYIPKCEDMDKPYTGQCFPMLEDAYLFYFKYGRICGFDVRKSTKKTNRRRELMVYTM